MRRYRRQAPSYWKPIQTGIEDDDDTAEVARLSECRAHQILNAGVRLPRPVSPHLAARLAGTAIELESVAATADAHARTGPWIVEGAGGLLVPLNDDVYMVDLIRRLGLPALVVSRSTLGTINHTLLTIEALVRRAIQIAGVVMVGPPNPENRRAIERYGSVPVVGELPMLEPLTPDSLQQWADAMLDPHGRLAELFE
jgi:dethiobiotin synthase